MAPGSTFSKPALTHGIDKVSRNYQHLFPEGNHGQESWVCRINLTGRKFGLFHKEHQEKRNYNRLRTKLYTDSSQPTSTSTPFVSRTHPTVPLVVKLTPYRTSFMAVPELEPFGYFYLSGVKPTSMFPSRTSRHSR